MSTSYKTINVFEKDAIFYLEINRPDKLNALNKTVLDEMLDAIKNIDVSKYKGAILTSVGDKAFMAGADIAAMSQMTPEETQGFALGGGCEMAMSCDFIYASKQAVFARS